ncbi:MAG: branched-chain amino acid ABC transporter permease [Lawsonibacter sp.]|nr:branched-chain amino acid ABC transporter permease [Lawsonibacter sp.]MCI8810590.1 branched-chain amino acid ABC transporter permease [Oscillibacter sp.]
MMMTINNLKEKAASNKKLLLAVFLGALVVFPQVSGGIIVRVGTNIMIYSIITMGEQLICGYTGMLNQGMAAFYGVGAYASALLALNLNLPWFVCFLGGGLIAALVGVLIAIPCLRVETDFLSLITIAFANIFTAILNNWTSLTRGAAGIPSIPAASLFGFKFQSSASNFYLILGVTILIYVFLNNLIHSRIGRAFMAVRDNEIGASSVGIKINRYKVLSFGIGTFCAGLAGSLMAHYIGFVGPTNFTFDVSLLILQMCIIGGLGSMPGAIVGAAFFTIMPEIIRPLAVYRVGVGGVIMILFMLFRPQGLLGSKAYAGKGGFEAQMKEFLRRRKEKCEPVK